MPGSKASCRFVLFLLGLAALTTLTACGSDNSSNSGDYDPYTFLDEDFDSITKSIERASFFCRSAGDCPDNVGLIMSVRSREELGYNLGQCTGFLVAPDIVATNSHCIPDTVKKGDSCSEQVAVRFLKGSESIVRACEKLVVKSDIKKDSQLDYAFFKIKPVPQKPLVISQAGAEDGAQISVMTMTPHKYLGGSTELGGVLGRLKCEVVQNSLLNLASVSKWSRSQVGVGCQSHSGNSGSPVLDAAGNVVGILFGMSGEAYRKVLESILKTYNIKMERKVDHMQFTNMACVPSPITGRHNARECQEAASQNVLQVWSDSSMTPELELSRRAELEKVFVEFGAQLPKIFLYEMKKAGGKQELKFQAVPQCVIPESVDSAVYKQYVQSGRGLFSDDVITARFEGEIQFETHIQTDEYYRVLPGLKLKKGAALIYDLSLNESGSGWNGRLTKTRDRFEDRSSVTDRGYGYGYGYGATSRGSSYEQILGRLMELPARVSYRDCTAEEYNKAQEEEAKFHAARQASATP